MKGLNENRVENCDSKDGSERYDDLTIGRKAIESIASHYNQEIHLSTKHNQEDRNATGKNAAHSDYDNEVPYFDPLLGRPMQQPIPFINYWLEILLNYCQKDHETDFNNTHIRKNDITFHYHYIQVYADLLTAYNPCVRTKCFQIVQKKSSIHVVSSLKMYVKENAHLLLIHYEVIIQQFTKLLRSEAYKILPPQTTSAISSVDGSGNYSIDHNSPYDHDETNGCEGNDRNNIKNECRSRTFIPSKLNHSAISPLIQPIHTTIKGLVQDLLYLTCIERITFQDKRNESIDENDDNNDQTRDTRNDLKEKKRKRNDCIIIVQNWILPTLLRILQHAIQLLTDIVQISSSHEKINMKSIQSCLVHSLLAASSFCSNYHNARESSNNILSTDLSVFEILPNQWKQQFTLRHFMETCAYSPSQLSSNNHGKNISKNDDNDNEYLAKLFNHVGGKHENTSYSTSVLNKTIINFDESSSSSTLKMPWLDNKRGIGYRSAQSLLEHLDILASILLTLRAKQEEGVTETKKEEILATLKEQEKSVYTIPHNNTTAYDRIIDATADIEGTIEIIRTNFFARLDHPFQTSDDDDEKHFMKKDRYNELKFNGILTTSSESRKKEKSKDEDNDLIEDEIHQLRAIKQLSKQNLSENNNKKFIQRALFKEEHRMTLDEDKPFNQIKARVASSVRLLASIKFPKVSTIVWSHALPIIYSLIDSIDASHQSLGGALFLHLLTESTPTSFLNSGNLYGDGKRTNIINPISNFESAIHILSMSIRTCDDEVSLSILMKTRSRLFDIVGSSTVYRVGTLRRVAVSDAMTLVKKRSYCGPNGEPKLVSALLATLSDVHFLLAQIALQPNADGMELGRLGLCTFLPLIRWDSSSLIGRRIQFTAISCLISLMMGAYPIMEKHGGKIMTELIACIGRCLRDLKIRDKIQDKIYKGGKNGNTESIYEVSMMRSLIVFAIHAASVAVIICGTRADSVLIQVEEGKYLQELIGCCRLIRVGSQKMLEKEKELRCA